MAMPTVFAILEEDAETVLVIPVAEEENELDDTYVGFWYILNELNLFQLRKIYQQIAYPFLKTLAFTAAVIIPPPEVL